MQNSVVYAVDPDLTKSGFACIIDGKYVSIYTMPLWDLFDTLNDIIIGTVYIEDANLIKGTYHKHGQQNVGKGKAVCKLIIDFCEAKGIKYERLKPAGYSQLFKDAKIFRAATGWEGKTNEDARAAAAMIYKFYKK